MFCKFSSFLLLLAPILLQMASCIAQNRETDYANSSEIRPSEAIQTGAEQLDRYLPLLQNKRIAMLVNQTSVIPDSLGRNVPLVDTLLSLNTDIRFLMAPEHGLLGKISAGDAIGDSHYERRQKLKVYSLYGKNKKPQREWLDEVDCVVFDIQDVGCRFYTYLSTLFYLLEACSESGTEVIVLDRPNPNDTIDGPLLDMKFQSFVGMIPVPMLHGCTLGELAQMIVGEQWSGNLSTKLTVIPVAHWSHGMDYSLPIAPSPNLRTDHAIRLYPSLCLLEATDISVGRGTDYPFEIMGHPDMKGKFHFTPVDCQSASHPLQEGKVCNGLDLREVQISKGFHLQWLMECQRQCGDTLHPTRWIKSTSFFDKLAGTDQLRGQFESRCSETEIRQSWQESLSQYAVLRKKYLLYPDSH